MIPLRLIFYLSRSFFLFFLWLVRFDTCFHLNEYTIISAITNWHCLLGLPLLWHRHEHHSSAAASSPPLGFLSLPGAGAFRREQWGHLDHTLDSTTSELSLCNP